ncbi:MAG TPA: hypothetical protein VMI54_08275 [Polyangiaceae bacterium]|nr:hypothetical protein [Polyangiaceae bacterium]
MTVTDRISMLGSALAAAGTPRETLPAECVAFMRANAVSEDDIAMLNACAFAGDLQIGGVWLEDSAD